MHGSVDDRTENDFTGGVRLNVEPFAQVEQGDANIATD